MAELTTLEAKLGEVTGLAMAAQGAGEKVSGLVEDDDLKQTLDRMVKEAKETEDRCTQLAEDLDGKKTAVLEKARETKLEAIRSSPVRPGPGSPRPGRRSPSARRP